jgi:peptide/nickel transport system permease protein
MSERPASRRQAALGRAYAGWRGFARNRLAMVGAGHRAGAGRPWRCWPTCWRRIRPRWVTCARRGCCRRRPRTGSAPTTRAATSSAALIHGSRITLFVVALVAVLAAPVGLLVGTAAGYAGGWLDAVLMRITDIFLAFPKLILALAFVAALGPGIENAVIAIAITSWPPYARIARAETLTIRQADYISAVKLLGASPVRIVLRHVMPLCLPSVIVRVTLDMAGIILTAAGLGFLGLGAQPPMPEWGAMIAAGRAYVLDQWWVAAAPGAAIFVVSLAFNLLGDGLRDALDPKSEAR